jgi:hypothetical protein
MDMEQRLVVSRHRTQGWVDKEGNRYNYKRARLRILVIMELFRLLTIDINILILILLYIFAKYCHLLEQVIEYMAYLYIISYISM